MSDALSGTMLPDDNHDRPWWGLPCTVTPCFGARLVQEGNRLHYLADRAGIRGLFSDADAYHLDQAFPLLMKQLVGSGGYVYLAVYPTPETKK